jgi:hypothetical protein
MKGNFVSFFVQLKNKYHKLSKRHGIKIIYFYQFNVFWLFLIFKQNRLIQRFLRSVSGTGSRTAPVGTGDYRYRHRHQPAPTGTDRPGLFYDVFDKNFQNIMPIWAI